MSVHNTQEERLLLKLVEEMPVAAEIKQGWIEQIKTYGHSEELAEEIRVKLEQHTEGEAGFTNRARYLMQLGNLTRRWRFASQKQVGKHR
jgi:hypothetical protein